MSAAVSTGTSSYLRHLPPVLAEQAAEGALPLGSLLAVVEKLLTGIDDGVATSRPPIAEQIARLHRTLDPWTTPTAFLPWLASWVALTFPTVQGEDVWDEYQRRTVTASMTRIHRLRGRKAGLNAYVDLYAVGHVRPRVALDDGSRVLVVAPHGERPAPVTGLVTTGPVLAGTTVRLGGVTRPWCLAVAPDGSIVLGDLPAPSGVPVQLPSRIWRLDATGRPDVEGTPPVPVPLTAGTLPLTRVVALAVRPATAAAPDTLYAVDRNGRIYAVPAPWRAATASLLVDLAAGGARIAPVAMVVDPAGGDLLVLDRGGTSAANPPRVVTIRPGPGAPTVTSNPLPQLTEALSLAVLPDGSLLIGDGGDQRPGSARTANLIRVDRGAGWTTRAVLPASNDLIAPTGIARTARGGLFVLDAGLRPFTPSAINPFICSDAEPAIVHEVDLASGKLTAVSEPGQLVYPTGMTAAGDRLLICDPGQPEVAGLQPFWSRVRPFVFDVVVHFTESRLPTDPTARQRVLRQTIGTVRSIIEAQKPAHTVWNLVTSI